LKVLSNRTTEAVVAQAPHGVVGVSLLEPSASVADAAWRSLRELAVQSKRQLPTYYFHIRDGNTLVIDDGQELADLEAVRHEALRSARDLREQDLVDHLFTSGAAYIAVCDEAGNEVLTQPIHLTNGE
jgi:hypothetical protein